MFSGRIVTSAAFAGACALACSCRSDHRVSPWPEDLGIESLVQPPDLQRQLARVEHEMSRENLVRTELIEGQFEDRSPFVILGFSGSDHVRRERTAVRVATGHGVVLALGPRDRADVARGARSRLAVSLVDGGGWRSGSDLNGDKHPDVVIRGDDGTLELWYLMPKGASPYAIKSIVAPEHAVDIDDDGRPDLAAWITMGREDAIAPSVLEVSTFEAGAYRNDTGAVKAWHARKLAELRGREAADGGAAEERSIPNDAGVRDERAVLAEAIEGAWHAVRAGEPLARALEAADAAAASRAPLGPGLAQSWVRWRGWLSDLGAR